MASTAVMEVDGSAAHFDDARAVSPTTRTNEPDGPQSPAVSPTVTRRIPSLDMRADPDAQATVTDYLDFTEYLPSDMMRSLTLIGKLDETYAESSIALHQLTTTWGSLPTLPADQRPAPVKLRSDISENVHRTVSSRVFSHAEACRMRDNVNRHYHRAKTILAKLQTMRDNYPAADEIKSPVQTRSPLATRAPKLAFRIDSNGQKIRGPPRITVPGEVLAPYEIDFNAYSDTGDDSSDDDDDDMASGFKAMSGPRIKLVKTPKVPKLKVPKPPRPPRTPLAPGQTALMSTSSALAALEPPPEDAVVGGEHAPWLQLTPYELAKLRKRMKKNAVWNPSDTMISRELKQLGRGVEAYKLAQRRAEEQGLPFEDAVPATVTDAESGAQHPAAGALSAESLTADDVRLSNRGMKLNEAKKLKREALAKMAADEAEESARKMNEAARMFLGPEGSPSVSAAMPLGDKMLATKKRKRDSASEAMSIEKPAETPDSLQARPQMKRTKTETPIPPPQLSARTTSVPPGTQTPIPVPQFGKPAATASSAKPATDNATSTSKPVNYARSVTSPVPPPSFTASAPTKAAVESPVLSVVKPSTTPILPPAREVPRRETRQNNLQPTTNPRQNTPRQMTPIPVPPVTVIASTAAAGASATENASAAAANGRRPTSRGKASSQEPPNILAAGDRARRTSTARNTPAPEARQPSKRTKRPAPGVVTTNPGGTSAVGKRKAAPRKKARGGGISAARRSSGALTNSNQLAADGDGDVEIDDDGNVVDANEPRYCLCNRVSFGTMIQCDNVDNCKQEWFHLECVGLTAIPARTTKWYCPDCRVALNIGGKGEVTSRGVKT
ncbi:inhibitor of growth protein 1 [Microdochium nivale]|nr:inhibitor of growth protein 1 [Microdochium nivale]